MDKLPKPPTIQRFLLSPDNKVLEATSAEGAQRFAREIAYLEDYVLRVGRILKMAEIRFGVVEDVDDQMAFRFSGAADEIQGMVNRVPHSLGEIVSGGAWEVSRSEAGR